MQIYSKNKKNCFFSLISWPIFTLFVLSDRARWRLQNLYTKFRNSLIMLIYANLRSPGRDPGVQSAIIFNFLFYFFNSNFFFFFSFLFMSLPGHQIFIFWPVENCTTWNLWYLMLRDAGWALRHWRSGLHFGIHTLFIGLYLSNTATDRVYFWHACTLGPGLLVLMFLVTLPSLIMLIYAN